MIVKRFTIKNQLGLHARPAALFVKTAGKFKSQVYVSKNEDGPEVNGKSIMGVMMLAAEMGSTITVRVDGVDEQEAMAALEELITVRTFDEQ